ncbi:MAG: ABC transporter ATP-binding protein [Clostridia bacterium]|nr:ABC transporter ATP-binding protein [Clostridia bacterium]
MKKTYLSFGLIKKFARYYKPHLGMFIFDLVCALLISVCNLVYPSIARTIMNDYAPNGQVNMILIFSGVLLAIFILKAVLNYCVTYYGHMVGVKIQGDMRKKLFAHLERLPFSYYDETKVGAIMSRITNDLFQIAELAHHGPEDAFLSIITIIGALIMILTIDPWLSLIVLVVLPPMFIVVIAMRKKRRDVFKENREKTALINASIESALSGIRVSKSYTAEEHEVEKFSFANAQLMEASRKNYKVMGKFHTSMNICMDLLYLVTLLAGGLFFCFGRISSGDMAAYILYISMLLSPIRVFVTLIEEIENGMSGFVRFDEILNIAPEYETPNPVKIGTLKGDICFDRVSFKYDKSEQGDSTGQDAKSSQLVINDMSLKIAKGQTVALVGPSGGGKTTLCNLLPRFYQIDSGKITIDGVDIYDMSLADLRKNIGIVQQDVFLYGGTVKENIAYGNLEATQEQIENAAKLANIHDFIMTLPDGYDTYVGERGVKLSGGQKQRVSIARAFLKNPPVLILDEATSALDNVTEIQIQESLEKLSNGRTTIVVAHRLSTVKNADEIIVINEDGIVERGNHQQLMDKNGIYADLYKKGQKV